MSAYNLRPRTSVIDYRCSLQAEIAFEKYVTADFNTPELTGQVLDNDIQQIIRLRYPNDILDNLKFFLHTYKHLFEQFNRLIEEMNENRCPEDKQGKHLYIIRIHDQMHAFIRRFFNQSYTDYYYVNITEDNLEKYLSCIRYGMLIKDFLLISMKIQLHHFDKVNKATYELYCDICKFNKKLQLKYKQYKERQYNREKILLLYTTKIPTDVCNYVIKAFL